MTNLSVPVAPIWVKRWCILDRFDVYFCLSFRDYRKALKKFTELSKERPGSFRILKLSVMEFVNELY